MKRKLISYEAFDEIEKSSLSNAGYELSEAEDILSDIFEKDVELHCFGNGSVLYETIDGTYVKANYKINKDYINFDNVEEVVIDEDSKHKNVRNTLSEMLDALLDDEKERAEQQFNQYMEMNKMSLKGRKRERLGSGRRDMTPSEKIVGNIKGNMKKVNESYLSAPTGAVDPKRRAAALKGHRKHPAAKYKAKITAKRNAPKAKAKRKTGQWNFLKRQVQKERMSGKKRARAYSRISPNKMKNMHEVATNVLEYVNFMHTTPVLQESHVNYDNQNITSIRVPTSNLRNEAKLLSLKWDTLKTDVKVIREVALRLADDADFCKSVAELKRSNNISDNVELEETINKMVINWPSVLYLTQDELAKTLSEALSMMGEINYDDQSCTFMAEGILRVAHNVHADRVNRIASLARMDVNEESEDPYVEFQDAVKDFYNQIDKDMAVENSVFEDLQGVLLELRHTALAAEDEEMRSEVSEYLESVERVISGESKGYLDLAEEVAEFINVFVETNLETRPWDVIKQPYRTTVGEHPQMKTWAKWSYDPASDFDGDWGDPAPTLTDDGGTYKGGKGAANLRSSWATKYSGGEDTYPSLGNPYVPRPFGNYKIKGEKNLEGDSGNALGQYGGTETWPNLDNPYIPKSVKPHANAMDRVDDVESRVGLRQASDLDQRIN